MEFDPQIWLAAKSSVVKEEDILSSVSEQQEASQIRIYPNPANEFTTLHTGHQEAGVYMIYDTGGKLIMTAKTTGENTTLDIKPLKSGKYFVKVGKGKKQSITELIKVD
ncbi:MAG: T9SS type A sorting domain-containing protein [Saprospiraceae bacterium]|nr:T9SS type A sorting domain-containing protein [Saprospiraceae bacterium]